MGTDVTKKQLHTVITVAWDFMKRNLKENHDDAYWMQFIEDMKQTLLNTPVGEEEVALLRDILVAVENYYCGGFSNGKNSKNEM